MELKEFAKKVQKTMSDILGEGYEVKVQEVQKNNSVRLQGLIILRKDQNVSPTIYLQPFWEAYEGGVTYVEVISHILQIYREDTPKDSIDMSFFKDFAKVKDRICYRLIHAERNKTLLEKIPHIPFLDLAICFYYSYVDETLGNGSILICNTHVAMWNTSVAELMRLAQYNTPRLFRWECNSMEIAMEELAEDIKVSQEEREYIARLPMYIVSNRQKIFGSACMIYPDLLFLLAEKMDSNFFILPSSIHEIILLKDSGNENPEELREMILEVNRTQVEPEEILSDSLYYFSRKERNVKII